MKRREFIAALIALTGNSLLARDLGAIQSPSQLEWQTFVRKITSLANKAALSEITESEMIKQGLDYLHMLDVNSESFATAVNDAVETGNRYWLWQRLIKKTNINGGILNIDKQQNVQLHDHPGATGLLRIISGEAEVWQYDKVRTSNNTAELKQVSRRILRAGDTAVVTPQYGNIHGLRSVSSECRMLDFFIPPYQTQQRTWFEPISKHWQDESLISCRTISQQSYMKA
jgi:hypothetical protein